LNFIYQTAVQWTLIALLLLDVLILFTELFLGTHVSFVFCFTCAGIGGRLLTLFVTDFKYPLCMYVTRDAISCCPVDGAADDHSNIRWLADDSHESFCQNPLVETDNTAGCNPHKWETVHNAEEALFIMTLTILSIFFRGDFTTHVGIDTLRLLSTILVRA
jgi:hypothetical protein